MYENGQGVQGVTKSLEKAFQYYKVAADKGCNMSQYNVGRSYYYGKGGEKDTSLALKYFSLSTDQNYMNAVNAVIILSKEDRKYLFQAIYRTNYALKIMNKSLLISQNSLK